MMKLTRFAGLMVLGVLASAVAAAPQVRVVPVPADARLAIDIEHDAGKGPEALVDGDPKTFLHPAPNTADRPVTLGMRFAKPLRDLAGIATGDAEPFANYYPQEMRFYVDQDGDGECETYVGMTTALGARDKSRGQHLFGRKPATVHGLDVVVTKQNVTGSKRAFSLNELQLLLSDETFGDDNLAEPTGAPRRAKGPPLDLTRLTPVVVLDMASKPRFRIIRDKANKHSSRFVTDAGKPAQQFTWEAGSEQVFFEASLANAPVLHGVESGIVLSVPVNADAFPGFRSIGLRVKDANGEIFRWSAELDPTKTGWQDVRVGLDPERHKGFWGGADAGRGVIDAPAQLASITLSAPTGFKAPASVRVGTIQRTELREGDISPLARISQVTVGFQGPRKAAVFSRDEMPTLSLQNNGPFEAAFTVQADLRAYDGHTQQWAAPQLIRVPAGQTAQLPMDLTLARMGWWAADVSLTTEDRAHTVKRMSGSFAKVDAVGPRPHEPDDFQFGIGGAGASDDTADAATLIGSDWTRGGLNWNELEKEPGKFDWRKFDEQVERAEKFGYRYQHLLGYGNTWAVRPEYVEKYKPKEGWWVNTLAPDAEKWRQFVRTVAQRYKGRVHYWEIWNEPDLSGFFKGTTDDYIELLRIAHEEIKRADPAADVWTAGFATVTNHGGHNLNPDLQRRTIAEAQDYFDAVAHHEHGTFAGFQAAVDGELADMLKALRSPKPLAFNETALDAKRGLEFQARTLVKKIAYAKAHGAKYYSWFHIYRPNDHEGFGMLDNSFQPRPIYPAFNEIVRQLRSKAFLGDCAFGAGRFGLLFGDGRDQVILAWREDDEVADALATVRVPSGSQVERVDLMGNVHPVRVTGDAAVFAVNEDPAYIVVRGAGAQTLRPGLLMAPLADVPDEQPGVVRISAGLVDSGTAATPVKLAAAGAAGVEGSTPLVAPLPAGADGKPAAGIQVTVSVGEGTHPLRVPIKRIVTIPAGPLADRRPDFVLDEARQVVSFYKNDPNTAHRDWKGPSDLAAKVWLARGEAGLRIRVDVSDDRAHQPFTGNDIWKADSLQIGIQSAGAAGFYEIGVAANLSEPNRPQLVMLGRPNGSSTDAIEGATVTTTPRDGGMIYDLVLPAGRLGLGDAAFIDGFRFNVVINDSDADGTGRDGFIELAPGIGQFKDHRMFPVVRFR